MPGSEKTLISLDRDRSELDIFIQKGDSFVWDRRYRCDIKHINELLELKSPNGSSLICRGKGEAEWIRFDANQKETPLTHSLAQKEKPWQYFERAETIRLENGRDILMIYDSEKSTYNFYEFKNDHLKPIMSFPVLERKTFRNSDEGVGNLRNVITAPMEAQSKHAIVSLIDDRILIYER
jgi:hypothetical protein